MFWRRKQHEEDLERELRSHLDLEALAQQAAGLSPDEARVAARKALGNATRIKEDVRATLRWTWAEQVGQDLRYSLRTLRRNPGFTAVAVLTMMLGIGVNTALFSLINAVLFRPTPVSHPENFYEMHASQLPTTSDLLAFQQSAHTVRDMAASRWWLPTFGETGEVIHGNQVSANYFEALGVRASLGHLLTAGDRNHGDLVVLSDMLWTSYFGRDPKVIGKSLVLAGHRYSIVGVAERGFIGTVPIVSQFWTLLPNDPTSGPLHVRVACRLAPGSTKAQAEAELTALSSRLYPQPGARPDPIQLVSRKNLIPLTETTLSISALLIACVGTVLLIACANLANLMLARAAARQREIAVRLSLGARRSRVVRQLVTESILIAMLGGLAALVASGCILPAAARSVQALLPPLAGYWSLHLVPDIRVFFYTAALCVAAGILFGLAPALMATRASFSEALKDSGNQGALWSRSRLRSALVVAQVALCLLLLINSGLLARSLANANSADPAFDTQDTIIVQCESEFGDASIGLGASPSQLLQILSRRPEVTASAAAINVPLLAARATPVRVAGQSVPDMPVNWVTEGYFATLAIPVLRGRAFTAQEVAGDAAVIVLSEGAAKRLFPDGDAMGKVVITDRPRLVTGIVRDTRSIRLTDLDPAYLYLPLPPRMMNQGVHLLLHAHSTSDAVLRNIRRDVAQLSEAQLLVYPLDYALSLQRLPAQAGAIVASILGALALLLASVGIYGVISYTVSQRTREVGIRMALGAGRREVVGLIVRQGMRLVAVGVAFGSFGAVPLSYILRVILYGVAPLDPVSYAGAPVLLTAIAMLAMASPTLRASRVDPATTLRHD